MSDFSLTLVLQIKTSKIINDMTKVQQKSEKITAFWRNIFRLGQILTPDFSYLTVFLEVVIFNNLRAHIF